MAETDNTCASTSLIIPKTKKKKIYGRVSDVAKHIRNHSFQTGDPCNCKRFNCFKKINSDQRNTIVSKFNKMSDRNEQNNYLCGLITIENIHRRRPRNCELEANLRENSFKYKVSFINRDGKRSVIMLYFKFR